MFTSVFRAFLDFKIFWFEDSRIKTTIKTLAVFLVKNLWQSIWLFDSEKDFEYYAICYKRWCCLDVNFRSYYACALYKSIYNSELSRFMCSVQWEKKHEFKWVCRVVYFDTLMLNIHERNEIQKSAGKRYFSPSQSRVKIKILWHNYFYR